MDSFKEFEGKSLDEVISGACAYFDAPREKLEIEIVQDSKSGIFGLVGARKAKVRARRVLLRTAMEDILGRKHGSTEGDDGSETEDTSEKHQEKSHGKGHDKNHIRDAGGPRKGRGRYSDGQPAMAEPVEESSAVSADVPAVGESPEKAERHEKHDKPVRGDRQERGDGRRAKPAPKARVRQGERPSERLGEKQVEKQAEKYGERQGEGRTRPKASPRPRNEESAFSGNVFAEEVLHEEGDELQHIPFEELNQDRLCSLSLEVVGKLVAPIVGELPLTVELDDGRVNVRMECGDDSGLLIGREGQTLASLQYLASRMVSRGMNTAVRVQLDAGEYRLRQDEKLREMALSLAEKVRASGKSHSTRPLSSYHRRIVHLVLQDSIDVQTRSSGDGPLKRVVVQRKRS